MADNIFELCELTEGGAGRVYLLPRRTVTLGRAASSDIVLPVQGISRRHASLTPRDDDDAFLVEDLESHNGTLVNGARIQAGLLRPGDILQLGRLRFELRLAPHGSLPREELETEHSTVELSQAEISPEQASSAATGADLLIRVARLLTESKDEPSYLHEVLALVRGATGAQEGQLYVYPNGTEEEFTRFRFMVGTQAPLPDALFQEACQRDGVLRVNADGALLCQPIREGRALALVFYLWKHQGQFLAADLALLKAVGQLAIFGLARLSLGERLLSLCGEISNTQRLAAVGQLAAGLMHEIRNPLGFVSANLQQLNEYADDLRALLSTQSDPRTRQLLEEIVEILQESMTGTRHITNLTRDVLGVARREEATEPVNLAEVIDSALSILKGELKRGVRVERALPEEVPAVRGQRGRLLQVMLNLLANALQALPRDPAAGLLRIALQREGLGVSVEVHDNGDGIAPEHLGRVFEPFFTTKPGTAGTGLGLSISKQIIDGYGGRLSLESLPGQGTSVRLWLPWYDRA